MTGPAEMAPDPALDDVVERMARMLAGGGLPLAAARMWAYLLVCEPPEQTAAQLAEVLHASRGSISGSARMLEATGLIRRSSRKGDRREYFSVPPGAVTAILHARLPVTTAWRRLSEEGLALMAHRSAASRARLEEVRDVYAFMEQELPAMLARFTEQRKERTP
jgi:DNA-binding transcriptional regulator GbsR (MarR family)